VDDAAAQRIQDSAAAAVAGIEQVQGPGAPAKKRTRAKKGKK